jgi:hypothetical protein
MVRYVDKDDTSLLVLKVQVWACTFMSSSLDVSYKSSGDSDYVPSASFGIYVWIKCMVKYTKKYSHIWQYMKAKPYQYGVKIWCLAMLNTSLCKKWKFIMVQVMRMLNMQLVTKLSLGMNIRIRITLSNVIKKQFNPSLS